MAGFDDLNRLAADLTAAAVEVQKGAPKVVAASARELREVARSFAPVDTGELRRSISTTISGLSAEIGPTAYYGKFVEWGTSDTAPAAFMGPAFDRVSPNFVAALEALGGNIL